MHELVFNLHMHTVYSDGRYTHAGIAQAALKSGLDGVIVTDHNVFVSGPQGYYQEGERRVLLLVGEEIHDQARQPQKSHLLVFGAGRELSTLADDTQRLLDAVRRTGGLAFIAHPVDPAAPSVHENDISWVDWQVQGFTGLELWNGFSEFKSRIKSRLHAIYFVYFPHQIACGPLPATLQLWDDLLSRGKRMVCVGGSDAHALPASLGPLRRTVFPYEFHFRGINTHVISNRELSGKANEDSRLVLEALAQGHAFIGYDLPASTRGFHFTAKGETGTAWMGDTLPVRNGVTVQIRLPIPTECRLIKDGQPIKVWFKRDICTFNPKEPGVYRVEAYITYLGTRRGWIYSNPIYLTGNI
jgi:hypothetical protein